MSPDENKFLCIASTGKSAGWRYLLGVPLIVIFWIVFGCIIILLVDPAFTKGGAIPHDFLYFIALDLSFIPVIVGTALAIRFLHGRSFYSLLSASVPFRWKNVFYGFAIWFAGSILQHSVALLFDRNNYQLTFSFDVLWQLPLLILLTFIQSGSEELLYRGYILQGTSLISKNIFVLCCINGFLFALPHLGNAEVVGNMILGFFTHFGFGFLWALTTIKSAGLELALGGHVANNVFSSSLVNYKDRTIPTASVFTIQSVNHSFELIGVYVFGIIAFLAFQRLDLFKLKSGKSIATERRD